MCTVRRCRSTSSSCGGPAPAPMPPAGRTKLTRSVHSNRSSGVWGPGRKEILLPMHEILEREVKWDVDAQFHLPDLDNVVAGGRVEHDTVDLTSEYYDTADRDLQAHGILLRRRHGDDDTGWQLKIPATDGR